jgi:hypothetical protein
MEVNINVDIAARYRDIKNYEPRQQKLSNKHCTKSGNL